MKESYVFFADGFEEIEALTVVDVLKRAEIPVKIVSINNSIQVTGAHGITVNADLLFSDVNFESADMWIILPGGLPGATNLHDFSPLTALLHSHNSRGGRIAAICAAPAEVLGREGLLKGEEATCYPGFESLCEGARISSDAVVISNGFVTANGPANAMLWALAIVKEIKGDKIAENVAAGLLVR